MGAGQSLWAGGGVIIVLMPYVHGRAQPVGKLLTPGALQLMAESMVGRPHQERFASDTPAHLLSKLQRLNVTDEGEKSVWGGKFNNIAPSART